MVCDCLLAIRAATGVVAIYEPYEQYWIDDTKYYALDTLPEFLALCILVCPTLMARMAQAYPKTDTSNTQTEADTSSTPTEVGETNLHTKQKGMSVRSNESDDAEDGLSPQQHDRIAAGCMFDSAQDVV